LQFYYINLLVTLIDSLLLIWIDYYMKTYYYTNVFICSFFLIPLFYKTIIFFVLNCPLLFIVIESLTAILIFSL